MKNRMKKEGKESENKESDLQSKNILGMCNALLNSGGGVLEMKISDPQNRNTSKKDRVDAFWQTIEGQLINMIRPSKYIDVFDRRVLSDKILLFINAPKHFCTMNYNLFVPGDVGAHEATYNDVVDFLSDDCKQDSDSNILVPLKELPKIPDNLSHMDRISLCECTEVEFKAYTYLLFSQQQRLDIAEQLSAFANSRGGVLLIGVTDNRVVVGTDMEKNSKEYVEKRVFSLVKGIYCNFELERGVHWDLTFFDLSGPKSNSVVVIKMAGLRGSGGVFGKCPESYELRCDQNGQHVPRLVAFKEWKKRMISGDADLTQNTRGVY